ncbi:MAG TPA: MBL fold metallo-hydrolase [Pseudolabrys sp.]|nr:MBL fold metallo-hydrolase [Pseudolabrys sp.]
MSSRQRLAQPSARLHRKARWPLSDHFDGKRFFNPTHPGSAPSPRVVLKMLREPRAKWPKFVENIGVPRLHATLADDEAALTFINHATFLIQFAGKTILTDPIWSMRAGPAWPLGPRRVRKPGVAFADLPKIDIVLLTHNHYDHLDLPTLRRLKRAFAPTVLFAAGDRRLIGPLGFPAMHELDWWDVVTIDDTLKITFVPAQHFSARTTWDRQHSLWGGYVIEHRGHRIYFEGDSGYSRHFAEIAARLGAPDIAILGIGAYEPRWFMTPVHMYPAEAVRAHRDLGARLSIGMHFGTFQLTAEAFEQPKRDLAAALAAEGIGEHEFITLLEGETRRFRRPGV